MIPALISFIVVAVIFLLLFRRLSGRNNPGVRTIKEMVKRAPIEGETVLTWSVVPPRWQRVAFVVLVAGIFIGWFVLGAVMKRFDTRKWAVVFSGAAIVITIAQVVIQPKKYRLTDGGLWCKSVGLFGDVERSKAPEHRLLRWSELADARFTPGHVVFYLRAPGTRDPHEPAPRLMMRIKKRVAVALPRENAQVEMMMREYVGRALAGTR